MLKLEILFLDKLFGSVGTRLVQIDSMHIVTVQFSSSKTRQVA